MGNFAPHKKNEKSQLPKVVSLFCGAGGLDLGFCAEGFEISLAIDVSEAAIQTHRRNFLDSRSVAANLIRLGPKGVLKQIQALVGRNERIGIIGGPPCQGFSRANTRAQANDPRNKLPMLYLSIIRCLQEYYRVEFVVFENVLGIRDKKHAKTYKAITDGLSKLGFRTAENELHALDFGVPQTRRRVVLIAIDEELGESNVIVKKRRGHQTVHDAIGNLPAPAYFSPSLDRSEIPVHPNHWTMQPRSAKFRNPRALRTNTRSFKRLSWELPSPTIAFGNREIHVHPSGRRRLSIFEAMLLQGFPRKFVLEGNLSEQVEQISNAVPPPLARSVAAAVKAALM
ncbi:MAG: DNA cytosine methyltransferase [Candidatus Obscuribacterales bacterium]